MFKENLKITECLSDLHTFFHKPGNTLDSPKPCPWSARLDRFYISHSEADLTVVKPVVTSDVHVLSTLGDRGFNSHVPTSLNFFLVKKSNSDRRRISDSTIEHENFASLTHRGGLQHQL